MIYVFFQRNIEFLSYLTHDIGVGDVKEVLLQGGDVLCGGRAAERRDELTQRLWPLYLLLRLLHVLLLRGSLQWGREEEVFYYTPEVGRGSIGGWEYSCCNTSLLSIYEHVASKLH